MPITVLPGMLSTRKYGKFLAFCEINNKTEYGRLLTKCKCNTHDRRISLINGLAREYGCSLAEIENSLCEAVQADGCSNDVFLWTKDVVVTNDSQQCRRIRW